MGKYEIDWKDDGRQDDGAEEGTCWGYSSWNKTNRAGSKKRNENISLKNLWRKRKGMGEDGQLSHQQSGCDDIKFSSQLIFQPAALAENFWRRFNAGKFHSQLIAILSIRQIERESLKE